MRWTVRLRASFVEYLTRKTYRPGLVNVTLPWEMEQFFLEERHGDEEIRAVFLLRLGIPAADTKFLTAIFFRRFISTRRLMVIAGFEKVMPSVEITRPLSDTVKVLGN